MSTPALTYLTHLLARRDYSEAEIRQKMREKAFPDEDIEQAIAHCQQRNWQSDQRFAENYVRYRANRGYGIHRIKQELRQLKGVPDAVIEQAIAESEIDWTAIAQAVLAKKFPQFTEKQSPKMKQKMWQYMFSHGFTSDEFADFVGEMGYE